MIFTVFYFVSKRSDLPLELRPTVMALLVGNIISLLAGSIIYSAMVIGSNIEVILGFMLQFLMAFLVENSLEALAGLFVGYVIRNKLTLNARASFAYAMITLKYKS